MTATDQLEEKDYLEKTDFMEDEKVPLASLSKLTGFPVDFIKKELVIEGDRPSMKELRASMLRFLQSTMDDIKQ